MIGSKKMINFADALKKAEKQIYLQAYKYHKQNQTLTARSLGVSRGTFLTRMKSWGEIVIERGRA